MEDFIAPLAPNCKQLVIKELTVNQVLGYANYVQQAHTVYINKFPQSFVMKEVIVSLDNFNAVHVTRGTLVAKG